jgi:hypothetical protein
MRRTKIAPVLTALLQDLTRQANEPRKKSYPMPGDAQIARLATAELRAIVAAVRAAERVVRSSRRVSGPFHGVSTLDAPLARLRRASHPGEER